MLESYARDRDASRAAGPGETAGQALFLGSRPMLSGNRGRARLEWSWRLEGHGITVRADAPEKAAAEGRPGAENRETSGCRDALGMAGRVAALLEEAAGGSGAGAAELYRGLLGILGKDAAGAWGALRNGGLALK
jgi:hypothetical protein